MLTRKQHELLMFIHERIKETGVSPSFDEMKEALDLASKSGIHRLITALVAGRVLRQRSSRAVVAVRPLSPPMIPANWFWSARSPPVLPSLRFRATTVAIRCRKPCWARVSTTCSRSRAIR